MRSLAGFALLLWGAFFATGLFAADCLEGDVSGDCRVDFLDVALMAERWLDPAGSICDIVGADGVNLADFAIVAQNWRRLGTGHGFLQVIILPEDAIEAGAEWRVDGQPWQSSGNTERLSVGLHNLEFSDVNGYTKPPDEVIGISENTTKVITRTYLLQQGSLYVEISPAGAVDAGAQWRIAGGPWRDSGQTVENLPVGLYTVEFKQVEPWITPPAQRIDVAADLVTGARARYRHPLVINEFLASNSNGHRDPQGDDDDWIEIYNRGSEPIDIGGMHLTDNMDRPTKWRVPTGNPSLTTVSPGGYVLIWADRDEADYPAGLHAGFEIGAGGGELGLFDSTGTIRIDEIGYSRQDPNISYGRYPDGNDTWRLFAVPSPASANVGTYQGFVGDVQFSHNRGFYEAPFTLTIACDTPGTTIYYSTDGTEPGVQGARGISGLAYRGPMTISHTTCIRARAIKAGWKPSKVDAQTYIFLDDVLAQSNNPAGFPSAWGSTAADYAMNQALIERHIATIKEDLKSIPTMSIVMKTDDLFGPDGIYTNWGNRGVDWERPCSMEFFTPDGSEQVQVNCGIRIYGGVGRREKKKTLRLLFKATYGASKLRYPIFGDDAADEFDTIILRANFNDGYPWGAAASQFIRDEFMRRAQLLTGHPSPIGNFVHLYINGLYWGLYNPTQRPDTAFSATYYGGNKEDWDGVNSGQSVNSSPMTAWNTLMNMSNSGLATNEEYQRLQGNNPDGTDNPAYEDYLDVDQYINFVMVNLWGGNNDWTSHNWYAGRLRGPESTGWKGYTWDAEWVIGMRSGVNDDSVHNDTPTGNWLLKPYTYLRANSEFRLLFGDYVHKAFFNGGVFYVDPARPAWDPEHPERNRPAALYAQLADEIEPAMTCETARWGDVGGGAYTIDHWRSERNWILNTYMPDRSEIVLGQLIDVGLYPDVPAPVFQINGLDQHGGHVVVGDLFSARASDPVYYTTDGSDPRLPKTSEVSGTTLVAENADKRAWVPDRDIGNDWRGGAPFDDSAWTAVTGTPGGIGYDERTDYRPYISYDVGSLMNGDLNPNANTSVYVRIPFNVDAAELAKFNFMTLRVRFDDGFVAFINGYEVQRNRFDTGKEPAWNSRSDGNHEAGALEAFDITQHLDKLRPGANILAFQGLNTSTGSSDFLISGELFAGWKSSSGGDISPTAALLSGPIPLEKSTHIKARVLRGTTWSALNEATYAVGPVAQNLRITEIMYNPQNTGDPNDPNEEFIEFKNIGAQPINLNLVRFTRGVDFVFGDTVLGAGEYAVIVKDLSAFQAAYPGFSGLIAGVYSGSLDNAGERVTLLDAAGREITDFRYSDNWRELTDGRGFSLTIIDPNDVAGYDRPAGIVGHWTFDEGIGNTAADSVGGNHATVFGAAWTTGKIKTGLSFDGIDDYLALPSIGPLEGASFTIEAWVLMGQYAGWNPIVIQHDPGTNGYYFYVYEDKPAIYAISNGILAEATSPDKIAPGQWHHLAGTNNGSVLRIYVDGQLKASGPSSGVIGVSHDAYFGYEYATASHYSGLIDDIRVHNRALDEDDFNRVSNPTERWGRKSSWRASALPGGSPGYDDRAIVPEPGAIVINEVLAHSHAEAADWIELHNTTDTPIDIGGWYLSDSPRDLKRYRIKDRTVIDPYGYLVLREDVNFGPLSSDPGKITPFAFSENGDGAYLNSGQGGVLTGYRTGEAFGASATGVSFGRYFKQSTATYNFVPMDHPTPGWANAEPKIGPVVISEIMYRPDWPTGGNYVNDRYEYVELHNITTEPVKLYRDDKQLPWMFTEAIRYTFPAEPDAVTILPGDYIVVVRDLDAFTWRYPDVPPEKIFGPYEGQLSNEGERIELSMPGDVDKFGRRHYIMVDRVAYSDGSHPQDNPGGVDLWPTAADGTGRSLTRKAPDRYGNDPANWRAAEPSPAAP